jgi:superfamily II DNA/RNA helicase
MEKTDHKTASGLRKEVKLYDHQQAAVDKVVARGGNLLLSHGTGSGKTLTALAAFEKMRDEGKADTALIVTPASLRVNFIDNGVKKFTNGRASMLGTAQEVSAGVARALDDPDPGARYHVVSYEMFMKDPEKVLKATEADTVIYDELHRIRNDQGVTYKSIKDARKHHKHFIGLTGSLMNNTPADLVPLVDAMTDGQHRLGTKAKFESRFIKETKDKKVVENPAVVRSLLAPYVHHFETKDMGGERMPKKVVEEVKVMMSPYQEELYRFAINKMDPVTAIKFRLGTTKLKKNDIQNIFSKIIQGRQVSNALHTMDLGMSLSDSAKKSPKVKALLDDVEEHLQETDDGQVVVHSNLIRGGVDVLTQGLKDRGITHAVFTGKGQPGMTEEVRQKAVEDFNGGKKRVIVISAAGGEGLDLRNATMFAGLDGHFNPEKVNQAESRAVRAGGLAHRAPEDRVVIVKRYASVVPRSVTQMAKDTMSLLSPASWLERISTPGAPLLFNPFKRERSPDEWMSEVATEKDVLNEAFRQQLKKTSAAPDYRNVDAMLFALESDLTKLAMTSAFNDELEKIAESGASRIPFQRARFIKSDKSIMDHYWQQFGDEVEGLNNPSTDPLKSRKAQVAEQEHVDALRTYYREAAKAEPGIFATKGVSTDLDYVSKLLKLTTIGGAIGATMALPHSLRLAKDLPPGQRIKAAILPAITGSVVAVPLLYTGLRNPAFVTSKAQARKATKFTDEELKSLLRGLSVQREEVKKIEHFIK